MATSELERPGNVTPPTRHRRAPRPLRRGWHRFWRLVSLYMPKRLYARSLIIVIAPMFLLQSVVAFVFMERNWQTVTLLLSQSVVRDIAAIIDLVETYPHDLDYANIIRIAQDRMQLKVDLLPPDPLPPPGPKPILSILDEPLSSEITRQINRPFWIDTVGNSNIVEVRVQLENKVLRVFVRRSQA
jgi:two-component system osmolarity sensor histidine kinase EnvZ